jgi:putative heme iron utilization protein
VARTLEHTPSPGDLVVLPSGVPTLVVAVDTVWDVVEEWGDAVHVSRTVYSLLVDGALQRGVGLPQWTRAVPTSP